MLEERYDAVWHYLLVNATTYPLEDADSLSIYKA